MNSAALFRIVLLVLSLALGSAVVRAENLAAVKTRMDQRVSAVEALKDRKLVGENNRGYLEARGGVRPEEQSALSDENADRRTVYQAIAAQESSDAEAVGRKRAQRIAVNSARGHWLQGGDGVWYQKQ